MKPNFLAQFTGERPLPVMWGLEVHTGGVRYVHVASDANTALRLAEKLRKLHPSAPIKVTVDCVTVEGGSK